MTKINWYNGKTANSASDMQKICDAVNRSLMTPVSAPADTKIVAVDTANSQKMLTIGDGLSIENDTLKASASGAKLYLHLLEFSQAYHQEFSVETQIITKNSTLFTSQSFYDYLRDNTIKFPVTGINGTSNTTLSLFNKVRSQGDINAYSFDGISVVLNEGIFTYASGSMGVAINNINLTDTVIEL